MQSVADVVTRTARRHGPPTLLAIVALALTACGGPPGTGALPEDVISGIVSAPEGYDVEGTEIQACIDADCFTVTITDTGREAPFTIEDLPEGDYTLAAFKPMGEDSFLAGCHGTGDGITCTGTPVSPPRQDVDIDMQLVEIAAPPEPPPAEE